MDTISLTAKARVESFIVAQRTYGATHRAQGLAEQQLWGERSPKLSNLSLTERVDNRLPAFSTPILKPRVALPYHSSQIAPHGLAQVPSNRRSGSHTDSPALRPTADYEGSMEVDEVSDGEHAERLRMRKHKRNETREITRKIVMAQESSPKDESKLTKGHKAKKAKAKLPSGLALMRGFTAVNVARKRITLKPEPSTGVFNKGKESKNKAVNGPQLAEMPLRAISQVQPDLLALIMNSSKGSTNLVDSRKKGTDNFVLQNDPEVSSQRSCSLIAPSLSSPSNGSVKAHSLDWDIEDGRRLLLGGKSIPRLLCPRAFSQSPQNSQVFIPPSPKGSVLSSHRLNPQLSSMPKCRMDEDIPAHDLYTELGQQLSQNDTSDYGACCDIQYPGVGCTMSLHDISFSAQMQEFELWAATHHPEPEDALPLLEPLKTPVSHLDPAIKLNPDITDTALGAYAHVDYFRPLSSLCQDSIPSTAFLVEPTSPGFDPSFRADVPFQDDSAMPGNWGFFDIPFTPSHREVGSCDECTSVFKASLTAETESLVYAFHPSSTSESVPLDDFGERIMTLQWGEVAMEFDDTPLNLEHCPRCLSGGSLSNDVVFGDALDGLADTSTDSGGGEAHNFNEGRALLLGFHPQSHIIALEPKGVHSRFEEDIAKQMGKTGHWYPQRP